MTVNCLIIDDEPLAINVIKNHIKEIDNLNVIDTFNSAIDALSFMKSNTVDLLFLDINMPKCTGFEFLERLSRLGFLETGNFKIFMLSSSVSLVDVNKANTHPLCSGYINKPLTIEKLHKVLNINDGCSKKENVLNDDSCA
mgnify:CR=1 FL=1